MLTAGTPLGRVRVLLRGEQFSDAEVESILQSCPGYHARSNELFQNRVAGWTACGLGVGTFLYYAIFEPWSSSYVLPLVVAAWGLFKLYRGPSADISATRWAGKKARVDERKSSIKKFL